MDALQDFHDPLCPLHSELPNSFYPKRVMKGSLSVSSLSFSPMRLILLSTGPSHLPYMQGYVPECAT